ncbi:hypothetical protein SUGI_0732060 [Cryptomeria japonica]|nr:hypothetical protein SUGI_0732060 [Cryptomeria japonica]
MLINQQFHGGNGRISGNGSGGSDWNGGVAEEDGDSDDDEDAAYSADKEFFGVGNVFGGRGSVSSVFGVGFAFGCGLCISVLPNFCGNSVFHQLLIGWWSFFWANLKSLTYTCLVEPPFLFVAVIFAELGCWGRGSCCWLFGYGDLVRFLGNALIFGFLPTSPIEVEMKCVGLVEELHSPKENVEVCLCLRVSPVQAHLREFGSTICRPELFDGF